MHVEDSIALVDHSLNSAKEVMDCESGADDSLYMSSVGVCSKTKLMIYVYGKTYLLYSSMLSGHGVSICVSILAVLVGLSVQT
jgi:hypothetical protein